MHAWLRDTYLVAREPGALHFPTLLRRGRRSRRLPRGRRPLAPRRSRPRWTPATLSQAWRRWESPSGGALRYGLAHRHRWVAAVQLARLEPGGGFRPGRARAPRPCRTDAGPRARRPPGPGRFRPDPRPPAGQVVFDDQPPSGVAQRLGGALDRPARPRRPRAGGAGRAAGARRAISPARDATPRSCRPPIGTAAGCRCGPSPPLRIDHDGTPRPRLRGQHRGRAPADAAAGLTGAQWAVARGRARGQRPGGGGRAAALDRHGARARGRPAPAARHAARARGWWRPCRGGLRERLTGAGQPRGAPVLSQRPCGCAGRDRRSGATQSRWVRDGPRRVHGEGLARLSSVGRP